MNGGIKISNSMKPGDKVKLTENPSWSNLDRTGWEVEVVQMPGYLAYRDKMGVTWPV